MPDSVFSLYLVRHAESETNAARNWGSEKSALTDAGKTQAHILGERFKPIALDQIITSNFERAKETGAIIASDIGWQSNIIETPLFAERRYPSVLTGKQYGDPISSEVMKALDGQCQENNHTWKHSDEESFEELVGRAQRAAEFCLAQEKQTLLVVSHATFLRAFVGTLIFREDFSPRLFWRMHRQWRVNNTGVTLLRRFPDRGPGIFDGWSMSFWNDRVHLGK